MILKKKKAFLSLVEVSLDDAEAISVMTQRKKYDHINIVSYNFLDHDNNFKLKKKQSARIVLGDDIDKLLAAFSDTCRKHIRRTFKIDNLYFKMMDSNFDKTYLAYCNFELANGRTPFSKSTLNKMLIFNAYYNNEIISSILCYDTKPSLKAHTIFSKRLEIDNKDEYKIIGYASKRLIYEICKYGILNNYTHFDLGSVNFDDESKRGINNFKLSFNPLVVEEYHYIYTSKRFILLNYINKIVKKILAIIGR